MPSVYSKSCSTRSGRPGRFWNRVDPAGAPSWPSAMPSCLLSWPISADAVFRVAIWGKGLEVPHVVLVGGLLAETVQLVLGELVV